MRTAKAWRHLGPAGNGDLPHAKLGLPPPGLDATLRETRARGLLRRHSAALRAALALSGCRALSGKPRAYPDKGTGLLNLGVLSPYPMGSRIPYIPHPLG